jgi:hypothetical protein
VLVEVLVVVVAVRNVCVDDVVVVDVEVLAAVDVDVTTRSKLAVNDPAPYDTTIVVGLLEEEREMEPKEDHEENT